MSVPVPKIDERSYDDIVAETEALVQAFTDWQPAGADGQLDAGGALIRIFSRMVEVAITRLNQVPEKNFLAFFGSDWDSDSTASASSRSAHLFAGSR